MAAPDYDVIKDIPGYKVILKSVLKSQIQQLVEQLATSTDEESVILTASVADGTLSHLGSESGKGFLEDHEDIKSQFLGFCLKKHHRKKQEEKERREAEALQQSMQTSPGRFGAPPGIYGPRSPRFASPRAQSVHPIALTRASPGAHVRSPGVRHEPYPMARPMRMKRTSLNFEPGKGPSATPGRSPSGNKLDGQVIKIEPDDDAEASNHSESDTVNQDKPVSSQSPSHKSNAPSSVKSESGDKDDDAKSESSNSTIPNEPAAEGLGLDSDFSNLISSANQQQTSDSGEVDPNVSVKLEALTENEMELEITGVEPGRAPIIPQDNWDPNVSMGMNFDPTAGATGDQGDLSAQGYNSIWKGVTENYPSLIRKVNEGGTDDQRHVTEAFYWRPEQSVLDKRPVMLSSEGFSVVELEESQVFVCNHGDCRRKFGNRSMMLRHMKIHTKDKPFACRYCNFRCSRKDNLRVHEFTHSNKFLSN